MAEEVEFRSEETIPELESMMSANFEADEVKAMIKNRRDLEYLVNKSTRTEEDCNKFINFELNLLKLVRKLFENKQLSRTTKALQFEANLRKRLNRFYILVLRWFPLSAHMWISYLKYCREVGMYVEGSSVLKQLLDIHGDTNPDLFKLAAMWELNDCNCIEKAREHLLKGIHLHEDSKMLLTEAFKLELLDAHRKQKECEESDVLIDSTNPYLSYKKAEVIYDTSMKRFNDIELMNELMNICAKYEFARKLENKICADLYDYDTDERMWDIFAKKELYSSSEEKPTPKAKITKCVTLYETAVKKLNTPRMWAYYLDMLLEISKDSSVLPNYKKKLLLSALHKGASAGKLREKYYLIWVNLLKSPEKKHRLLEMLQGAVKKLPKSQALWHNLLRVHLRTSEETYSDEIFVKAVSALGSDSLDLWKMMIHVYHLRSNINKVEEIFKKAMTECPEISSVMRPKYLEWLVLNHGIISARKTYDIMCELPPPCLEIHKKMVFLESVQTSMNMKRMRKSYTIACAQFGAKNVGVWVDFCKFEINSGDPDKASEIYRQARENLDPQKFDTFNTEYSLI